MADTPKDALDPGADGSFPHWPRNPDGTTDETRMPMTPVWVRAADGRRVYIDPAPGPPEGYRHSPTGPVPE